MELDTKGIYIHDEEGFMNFLNTMAYTISEMFGKKCEVVVSDLDNPNESVLFIYNGHVTGRDVGDSLTTTKDELVNKSPNGLSLNYKKAYKKNKKEIKSSTIVMNAYGRRLSFCINYDCDELYFISNSLKNFLSMGEEIYKQIDEDESLLEPKFSELLGELEKPFSKMNKRERVDFIRILKEKGVFTVQKSIPYVSKKLGISRYTIYNYLNEIEGRKKVENEKK